MGSKECMNGLCRANSSVQWKKGWPLRSGELSTLCNTCGTAYEQLVFCDVFHSNDTGWRECSSCGKRLHCGCIASSSLLELLESGGVSCISCVKSSQLHNTLTQEKDKGCTANSVGEEHSTSGGSQMNGCNIEKTISMQFDDGSESLSHKPSLPSQHDTRSKPLCQIKLEEVGSTCLSNFNQALFESSQPSKSKLYNTHIGAKEVPGSPVQTNLSISLSVPSGNTNIGAETVVEERELGKMISSFAQGSRSRHIVPKPPKSSFAAGLETTASMVPQIRVARPPVEGRIKNQLLPRYWPRITDQELQQISGDSNSTIVPLFEKVLSASDAGRIGRLVLPKACAEAYFPPISQPEGLPLRIQDIKGKEWVFQFRFWPNNNSRMYVLEGVTPCIQSMQLQAGDTVIFSRMDPEGKLLMGFRKASNAIPAQDANLGVIPCGAFSNETFFSAVTESVPIMSGYSGMLQSFRGSREASLNASSKHLSGGDLSWWYLNEKIGNKNGDGPHSLSLMTSERKRSRNLGSKSKRLLIDRHDALELKLSWEEIQDMLRPPLSARLSTVMIEDHEFEEYEEPPVFAKRSIFTVRLSGEQEQWAQCDNCFKWRRLPADYLLPPQWTCRDNIWDVGRCSCSASDELAPQELECLLKMDKDLKKRRNATSHKSVNTKGSCDVDAQANGGGPRDDVQEPGSSSVATTTKHPRHRPGCSCIVCIQPPSGKGKHKPSCSCNVCMTVKRRFKTLMMRKKKRQSEREAELAQRNQFVWGAKEEAEVDSIPRQVKVQLHLSDKERSGSDLQPSGGQSSDQLHKIPESGSGKAPLDLNCHPDREVAAGSSSRVSMVSLLQRASLPLENYLKQNGLMSLASEQQGSSGSQAVVPQDAGENEVQAHEDQCNATAVEEHDSDFCDELSERDESAKEP
nr:B3 domain-containing transcription repressor VAL2-like isoform X1 [Ipomoea batatas]GME08909.1 B3 domain-containing transcription repressor VAL2-like isoform X1 [Ipomoea batatas]